MIEKRVCTVCGVTYERLASMTFDQGQCDGCITAWARERAAQHADAAITLTGDPSKSSSPEQICVLREALRIHKIWSD